MIYIQASQWNSSYDINTYALQTSTGQYIMDSANEPWSFSSLDNNIFRFEVRQGDRWFNDPATAERSEIAATTQYDYGTPINVSYKFMIEPGAANTSAWTVLGQLHQNDFDGEALASPPVAIAMIGEKMAVQIGWTDSAGVNHNGYIYTSPTDIVRGQYYNMNIAVKFNPTGAGQLIVTSNGQTIASYTGPLGIANHTGVFWKEGIYQAATAQTMAVNYGNLKITTGASVISASSTPALASNVSSVALTFASNNLISSKIVSNVDRSRDVYKFVTNNGYYLSSKLHYNPAGTITQTVDYSASNIRSLALTLNADGSNSTFNYNISGGLTKSTLVYTNGDISLMSYANNTLTQKFIQFANGASLEMDYSAGALAKQTQINPDGSKTSTQFGITGQNYVSQTSQYNAAGQVFSIVQANSAGLPVFSQFIDAAGTKTVEQYTSAGVQTHSLITTATGVVTNDWYDTNGKISAAQITQPNGSYVYDTYNSGGALTQEIATVPGVSLTSKKYTAATNADGSAQYTKSVTAYKAGLVIGSDGINDTFNSFGTDTFAFSRGVGTDVINNFHAGSGVNHDLIQLPQAVVPGFSALSFRQSGADTLLTISANDSVRLTGVTASTFTSADVKFT